MYIIKHGTIINPEKDVRPIEFTCNNCHCKFVAKSCEYIEGKKNSNCFPGSTKKPRTRLYVCTCPECHEVILVPEHFARFCEDRILDISELCKPGFSDQILKLISNRDSIDSGLYKISEFSVTSSYGSTSDQYEFRLIPCAGCFPNHRTLDLEDLDGIELYKFDVEKPLSFIDIVSLNLGLVYVESEDRYISNGVYHVDVDRGGIHNHINEFYNTSIELTKLRTDKYPKDSPNIVFGYGYEPNIGLKIYSMERSNVLWTTDGDR